MKKRSASLANNKLVGGQSKDAIEDVPHQAGRGLHTAMCIVLGELSDTAFAMMVFIV